VRVLQRLTLLWHASLAKMRVMRLLLLLLKLGLENINKALLTTLEKSRSRKP